MSNSEDQDTPVDDNGSEATSPSKRNESSAQGGNEPSSKRFKIIYEEEDYKWSQPQDMASYANVIQRNISQKKMSKREP